MYASRITEDITFGKYPSKFNIKPVDATECRRFLQQIINTEKKIMKKDKKANETEEDKIRKKNNNNKKQLSNHKLKIDKVCWKYVERV